MPMRQTGAIREQGFGKQEALLAAIRDRIAHFKLPKKIIFVEEFPRNSVGKILKKELKERLS